MNVSDIPDYVSPIVGYRAWNWDSAGVRSLNGKRWFAGRALTAQCPTIDHETPADGCSCGVYAAKNYQHLQKIVPHSVDSVVHGEVYLWGKVVEHDLGYRAQFAYPKSFVLPWNIHHCLEPSSLKRLLAYGTDISLPPNILLWTKGSGYTSAGSDWLMGRGKPCGEWCKQWHERTLQMGDWVTVFGRGIGLVERDNGTSECTSDSVCIRLGNNDLYIIPHQDIVWNCQDWLWEVDLSRYTGTVILPSSKGWKILCRSLEIMKSTLMSRHSNKTPLLPNPVSPRTSAPPKSREELSTDTQCERIKLILQREQIEGTEEELMFRSLPRGEDR